MQEIRQAIDQWLQNILYTPHRAAGLGEMILWVVGEMTLLGTEGRADQGLKPISLPVLSTHFPNK